MHMEQPVQGTESNHLPAVVVTKFYRPGHWCNAAIAEERAFAAESMAFVVPMIGSLILGEGKTTLYQFDVFAFSVSSSRGGRRPRLGSLETLEWIDWLLARLHNVGS